MLKVLEPFFHTLILTRFQSNPRNVPPERLRELLPREARVLVADDPVAAVLMAQKIAGPDDLICVAGSVFLAGETRPLFANSSQPEFN